MKIFISEGTEATSRYLSSASPELVQVVLSRENA